MKNLFSFSNTFDFSTRIYREIDSNTESAIKATFDTAQEDQNQSNLRFGVEKTYTDAIKEISDTLDFLSPEEWGKYSGVINQYLKDQFSDPTFQLKDGVIGINTVEWTNWVSNDFEAFLTEILENPEKADEYLANYQAAAERAAEVVTDEEINDLYGDSGVLDLLKSTLSEISYEALIKLAVQESLSPTRLLGMGELIGQIDKSIENAEKWITEFGQSFNPSNSRITILELNTIRQDILNGGDLLQNRAAIAEINQRIGNTLNIAEAYTDENTEALSDPEVIAKHDRLNRFLDGVESATGDKHVQAIVTARAALQRGNINKTITAIESIVEAELRSSVLGMVFNFQFDDAEMNGEETVITADMISENDEALMQALRYIGQQSAATDVALENSSTDQRIADHVKSYVEQRESEFLAQATEQINSTLERLERSNPVRYEIMKQEIEIKGMDVVASDYAKNMAALAGFRDFVENNNNSELPELAQIYADMKGLGWFDLSDTTIDVASGILMAVVTSGPFIFAGVLRGAVVAAGRSAFANGGRILTQRSLAKGAISLGDDVAGASIARITPAQRAALSQVDDAAVRITPVRPVKPNVDVPPGVPANTPKVDFIPRPRLTEIQRIAITNVDDAALRQAVVSGTPSNLTATVSSISDEALAAIRAAATRSVDDLSEAVIRAAASSPDELLAATRAVPIFNAERIAELRIKLGTALAGAPQRAKNMFLASTSRFQSGKATVAETIDTFKALPRATQQNVVATLALSAAATPLIQDLLDNLGPLVPAAEAAEVNPASVTLPTVEGIPVAPETVEAPAEYNITITARNLRLRSEAGTDGEIASKVNSGDRLEVIKNENGELVQETIDGYLWQKVKTEDGTEGWIAIQSVDGTKVHALITEVAEVESGKSVSIQANGLRLRSSFTTNSDVVQKLSSSSTGWETTGLTKDNNEGYRWAQIKNEDQVGWIALGRIDDSGELSSTYATIDQ